MTGLSSIILDRINDVYNQIDEGLKNGLSTIKLKVSIPGIFDYEIDGEKLAALSLDRSEIDSCLTDCFNGRGLYVKSFAMEHVGECVTAASAILDALKVHATRLVSRPGENRELHRLILQWQSATATLLSGLKRVDQSAWVKDTIAASMALRTFRRQTFLIVALMITRTSGSIRQIAAEHLSEGLELENTALAVLPDAIKIISPKGI
jgi:hypothetical protein